MGVDFLRDERGQMTVELAVAFPVLIVVAALAVNALQFFSLCAAFDRAAHNEVRLCAASPAYGSGADPSCAQIRDALSTAFAGGEDIQVQVSHSVVGFDFDEYTAALDYYPTLFGLGLRSEIFGVSMPYLHHETRFVVDSYRPGVIV